MSKVINLIITLLFALISVGGMAAMGFGWEPPTKIIALTAFTALLFSSTARAIQQADDL